MTENSEKRPIPTGSLTEDKTPNPSVKFRITRIGNGTIVSEEGSIERMDECITIQIQQLADQLKERENEARVKGNYPPMEFTAQMIIEEAEEAERRGLRLGNLVRLKRDMNAINIGPNESPFNCKASWYFYEEDDSFFDNKVLMYLGTTDGIFGHNPGYSIKVQRWLWNDKIIMANIHPSTFSIIDTRHSRPKLDPEHL